MKKKDFKSTVLRGISIIIILVFSIFIILCFFRDITHFNFTNKFIVSGARINLTQNQFNNERPVALNGDWDVFPGLYLEKYDPDALAFPKSFTLPTTKIALLNGYTTYRITLDTAPGVSDLSLYIPNYQSSISIYINGILQKQPQSGEGYWDFKLAGAKIFQLNLEGATANELVLSVGTYGEENPLYKRELLIGSHGSVYIYAYLSMANNVFLFGVLIILTISAFIFVFLYPKHRIISLITILDCLIIFHVLFGIRNIMDFIGYILGGLYLTDSLRTSLQIFFLMMSGGFGAVLARFLFDAEKKTPRMLWQPLPYIYVVFAFVFSIRLDWTETFGVYLMLIVFLYTAIALAFQLSFYWIKNKNIYAFIQIIKTVYFGIVVMLDILFMYTSTNMMYFAYAYILFLLVHLVVRLYDNKMSYSEVEILNISLEQKVLERTAELVALNQTLSNISIRDTLTNAYNRLHFERHLEQLITQFDSNHNVIHLCMFDLDYFKNINDTYGHAAGDEQLKTVVNEVNDIIDDQTLLARIGGEEFILLFNGHSTATAENVLERIRQTLESDAHHLPGHTTASFGLVRYKMGMRPNQLLKKADVCLYRAKEEGRNRIVVDVF